LFVSTQFSRPEQGLFEQLMLVEYFYNKKEKWNVAERLCYEGKIWRVRFFILRKWNGVDALVKRIRKYQITKKSIHNSKFKKATANQRKLLIKGYHELRQNNRERSQVIL